MPPHRTPLRRSLMVLAAAGLLSGSATAVRAQTSDAGTAASTAAAPAQLPAAVIEAQARAAAERVLQALRAGDAKARYAQFAPRLQRMTSPSMVQSHLVRQPKLLRWTITSVVPGMESSIVDAKLVTAAGERLLSMAIDTKGRLEGYHYDASDQPAAKVAQQFVEALGQGRFVLASSFLSSQMQAEISPANLQVKWQNLQRLTGNFVRVRKAFQAENTTDARLVLVNTEFNRFSDNLFVILNGRNEITGVDFPKTPNPPASAP
ncbi:MAG: DUF3887 domain-containing protein [Cyanobium sp.]|jgi:hypothetical protein